MARNIVWTDVESSSEGYDSIEPGAYVAVITGMTDNQSREYMTLTFDIAEGEHKGYFSDNFYADKPWAHSMILSYKPTALPMTKGRLETITKCNPGFDALAAFNSNEQLFVGKGVGVVMRREQYLDRRSNTFKIGSPRAYRFCSIEDVSSGKFDSPADKMMTDEQKSDARERAGLPDVDPADLGFKPVASAGDSTVLAEDVPF